MDLRQSVKNNDARAYLLDIDGSSKMTGDGIVIDTSTANLLGEITASGSELTIVAGSANIGGSVTCSGASTAQHARKAPGFSTAGFAKFTLEAR